MVVFVLDARSAEPPTSQGTDSAIALRAALPESRVATFSSLHESELSMLSQPSGKSPFIMQVSSLASCGFSIWNAENF